MNVTLRRVLVSPTSRRVHVAKMLTWRVIATATTVVVSYLVTGDLLIGATIGGIEATSKMALYYGHERAWTRLLAFGVHTATAGSTTSVDGAPDAARALDPEPPPDALVRTR